MGFHKKMPRIVLKLRHILNAFFKNSWGKTSLKVFWTQEKIIGISLVGIYPMTRCVDHGFGGYTYCKFRKRLPPVSSAAASPSASCTGIGTGRELRRAQGFSKTNLGSLLSLWGMSPASSAEAVGPALGPSPAGSGTAVVSSEAVAAALGATSGTADASCCTTRAVSRSCRSSVGSSRLATGYAPRWLLICAHVCCGAAGFDHVGSTCLVVRCQLRLPQRRREVPSVTVPGFPVRPIPSLPVVLEQILGAGPFGAQNKLDTTPEQLYSFALFAWQRGSY